MATNLAIDDTLIESARRLGHHRTKREAVTQALNDYIQRLKQQEIIGEFGKIEFQPDYDYKKQRNAA
ncbi:MAG: type II toxin-antitoxin system VapB family antitoxin [Sulfuricella sp.]|nr:type II toxin-antitoxin system VapB family antitoxin [Sulfuricella sp.]